VKKLIEPLFLACPVWVVILALLVYGCSSSSSPSQKTVLKDCLAIESLDSQLKCLAPLLRTAVATSTVTNLVSDLASAKAKGTIDDCHMIAHHLGHEAFGASGNLARALEMGDVRCMKGYYHGVMEAALAARAKQGERGIVGLCDPFFGEEKRWDGCVHGLGHGLMWRNDHDLERSMADCDTLSPDQGRRRCEDGVLMENSLRYALLPDDEYVSLAPRACDARSLTNEQRLGCQLNIGAVAMLHYRHDLSRALALCTTISGGAEARAECERGAKEEAESVHGERG
jgi:hypothetical protein